MSNPYYNPQMNVPRGNRTGTQAVPPPAPAAGMPPSYIVTTSEERLLAALAHGSALITLFTGFAGILISFFIWLSQRDRSTYVAYQALQATVFQLVCLGIVAVSATVLAVLWVVTGILAMCLVGLLLVPFALAATLALVVLPFAAAIYSLVAAYQTYNGRDYRYPSVGNWLAKQMHTP